MTIDKYLPQTEEIMSLLGYKLHARLIWDKGNGPAPAYTVRFAHEYLLWFYKKGNIMLPDKDKRGAFSTVLRENSKRHPEAGMCLSDVRNILPTGKEAGTLRKSGA